MRPSNATGNLQTVSLYNRDPNRRSFDSSGIMKRILDQMPPPNNFRTGDGLNTAGFTWHIPYAYDTNQYDLRIDHHFSSKHRLSGSYNLENEDDPNDFMPSPYPGLPGGLTQSRTRVLSIALLSTLGPNLLNEFRGGYQRPRLRFFAPWEVAGSDYLPRIGTQPYLPVSALVAQLSNPYRSDNDPQGRITPVYQYADNVTWLKSRHTFKGGAEVRFVSTNGFNSFDVMPRVNLGAGGVPVQNIDAIPGIGQNQGAAQSMLNDLTGSVDNIVQAFNSPGGKTPQFLAGEGKQRTWKTREYSFFFKDDFKVTKNLTLNLGLRYEYYGVPFEANGKAAGLVGGAVGVFGISGAHFSALLKPGLQQGSLTRVQLVGPNSPNPNTPLYNPDRNNFAPAAGLAWELPGSGPAGHGPGPHRR